MMNKFRTLSYLTVVMSGALQALTVSAAPWPVEVDVEIAWGCPDATYEIEVSCVAFNKAGYCFEDRQRLTEASTTLTIEPSTSLRVQYSPLPVSPGERAYPVQRVVVELEDELAYCANTVFCDATASASVVGGQSPELRASYCEKWNPNHTVDDVFEDTDPRREP